MKTVIKIIIREETNNGIATIISGEKTLELLGEYDHAVKLVATLIDGVEEYNKVSRHMVVKDLILEKFPDADKKHSDKQCVCYEDAAYKIKCYWMRWLEDTPENDQSIIDAFSIVAPSLV